MTLSPKAVLSISCVFDAVFPSLKQNFTQMRFCFKLTISLMTAKGRDSTVGIALGYGLDDRRSKVRFPAGDENFSLHHRVQNGSETHPASYPMGTRGYFLGDKSAGA
jgi:hypothetical protein